MTLTEFLLKRITEDEADARAEDCAYADTTLLPSFDSDHQERWSTARVLAECEAKRRIVDIAKFAPDGSAGWGFRRILRTLALPYTEHPDYREEWRP